MSNNNLDKRQRFVWVLVDFDPARKEEDMASVISVHYSEKSAKKAWRAFMDEEHAEHITYFIEQAPLVVD